MTRDLSNHLVGQFCGRMKKDLRIELFLEYLECLIHHILCLRGVYPEGKKRKLNSRTF
jgi:hypothetical protein